MEITLNLAQLEEIPYCVEILSSARRFQREQGFVQWQDGYPGTKDIEADVSGGNGYVVKIDGKLACYLYIGFSGDPAYRDIQGKWRTDGPYAVVHRIGMHPDFRGKGLIPKVFALIEEFVKDKGVFCIRIDTGEENFRMQHVLSKCGYAYCGTVIQNGGIRLAYDKLL